MGKDGEARVTVENELSQRLGERLVGEQCLHLSAVGERANELLPLRVADAASIESVMQGNASVGSV